MIGRRQSYFGHSTAFPSTKCSLRESADLRSHAVLILLCLFNSTRAPHFFEILECETGNFIGMT